MRKASDIDNISNLILWLSSNDVTLLGDDDDDHGLNGGLRPEARGLGADLALVRSGRVEAQVCQDDLLLRGLRFLERKTKDFFIRKVMLPHPVSSHVFRNAVRF